MDGSLDAAWREKRRARALCRASSCTMEVGGWIVREPEFSSMDSSPCRNRAVTLLDARPGIKRGPYVRMAASRLTIAPLPPRLW
jgi:hypothetical protein